MPSCAEKRLLGCLDHPGACEGCEMSPAFECIENCELCIAEDRVDMIYICNPDADGCGGGFCENFGSVELGLCNDCMNKSEGEENPCMMLTETNLTRKKQ